MVRLATIGFGVQLSSLSMRTYFGVAVAFLCSAMSGEARCLRIGMCDNLVQLEISKTLAGHCRQPLY